MGLTDSGSLGLSSPLVALFLQMLIFCPTGLSPEPGRSDLPPRFSPCRPESAAPATRPPSHWSPPRIPSHGHHLLKSQVPTKGPGARPTTALRGDVICSGSQHWRPDVHFLVCRTSPQGSQQQGHLDTALEGSSGDRGAGLVGAQEAGHWRTACAHGVPACSSSGGSEGELC